MEKPTPQKEHEWLQKLVGEWTMEGTGDCGPDQPPMKSTGKETVRSMDGIWVVCDGEGSMPDGTRGTMMMTLGYDAKKQRFVGSWVGSMMTNMWIYEGELDESGRVLSLRTEGPGFKEDTIGQYKDVIEFLTDDHRTLTSHNQQEDGSWKQFMRADYRRVK